MDGWLSAPPCAGGRCETNRWRGLGVAAADRGELGSEQRRARTGVGAGHQGYNVPWTPSEDGQEDETWYVVRGDRSIEDRMRGM